MSASSAINASPAAGSPVIAARSRSDPDDPFRAGALLSRAMALLQRGEWARQQSEAQEAVAIFERHVASVGVMPRRLHWFHAEAYYFRLMGQAMMGEQLATAEQQRALALARGGGFDDVCFCLRLSPITMPARSGSGVRASSRRMSPSGPSLVSSTAPC
jgi:hypothetical protein